MPPLGLSSEKLSLWASSCVLPLPTFLPLWKVPLLLRSSRYLGGGQVKVRARVRRGESG